jgi:hypothetical protein
MSLEQYAVMLLTVLCVLQAWAVIEVRRLRKTTQRK